MINDELHILDRKIKEFNNIIKEFEKRNFVDDLLLREKLNDLLGQFEVCLKNIDFSQKNKRTISAIRYVNNVKKHSKSIFKYSLYTLEIFPSDDLFPSDNLYPTEFKIWWNELPLDKKEYSHQYNCYNEELLNKDLIESINDIYNLVKEMKKSV